MMISIQARWIKKYRQKDALWIHDGNPLRPHALLTSEKHSDGFFNSRRVIPDEELLRSAAFDLLVALARVAKMNSFDGIVGPQTGATKLAEFMSDAKKKYHKTECFWASPAKGGLDGVKSMVFNEEEAALMKGRKILLCEDVISTGGSIELTAQAVVKAGGTVIRHVCTLVNRSGQTTIDKRRITALISRSMPMWEPDECPLCKVGSEAILAKDPVNWARLNASY